MEGDYERKDKAYRLDADGKYHVVLWRFGADEGYDEVLFFHVAVSGYAHIFGNISQIRQVFRF